MLLSLADPKVTQLTAGTGAEDRPRFAILAEARPVFSSEEASATPGVGQVAFLTRPGPLALYNFTVV